MKIEGYIKIAIVDDHYLYKKGLKLALSSYNDIDVVINAENGLHLLNQLTEAEVDLVLLDIKMPIMDGEAVLPVLKKRFPGIKVIILSMYNDDSLLARLYGLGADAFVSKHADLNKLYNEIKEVVRYNLRKSYQREPFI